MSPCLCHGDNTMNQSDLNFLEKQHINMNIKQEFQEKPLDLSIKLDEKKEINTKAGDTTVPEIKKEAADDIKNTRERVSPVNDNHSLSQSIVNQRKSGPKGAKIAEAKHRDLPMLVQGYSRTHNHVVKRPAIQRLSHLKQSRPQSVPKVEEHGEKKRHAQYISSGLSGGTCKVVNQGTLEGLLTPSWKLLQTNGTRSTDSSPIPTVVQNFGHLDHIPNSRPSSTPQIYPSVYPQNGSELKPRHYGNHVLRNVNDLVRRRNELLCKAKSFSRFKHLQQDYPRLYESQNPVDLNVSTGVAASSLLPNSFQLNLDYTTPVGGVSVTTNTALTVQPRGLCGGTMVSCEPSAESMVAAIQPPLQIHNIHLSNLSFSTNYNVLPIGREQEISSDLSQKVKTPESEFQTQNYPQKCQSVPDMNLSVNDKSKQSNLNKTRRPSSAGNLTLLSNICSLIKDKEMKDITEEKKHSDCLKLPVCPRRSVSPECDLPLKKRKV